jgi:hypothetical protein
VFRPQPRSVDLAEVLSSLTGRRVRIGEIIAALNLGRSTYYEQRDAGRLISADNLLRLAAELKLNPVELLLRCGLVSRQAVAECSAKTVGAATRPVGEPQRLQRLQRRPDAPPL